MGYRRRSYSSRYNNYAVSGGYDSTGRWRSEAWHMDGGANDEGWHQAWCSYCGKETEHGRGSGCVPCGDRIALSKTRSKIKPAAKSTWKADRAVQLDRMAVIRIYEANLGFRPNFLKSLDEQLNAKRKLSKKQIEIGAKVLAGSVDQDIIDRLWTRTSPRGEDSEMKVGSIVRLDSACDPRVVTGKNCPWGRYDDEFEIKSLKDPELWGSTWTNKVKDYVVIK